MYGQKRRVAGPRGDAHRPQLAGRRVVAERVNPFALRLGRVRPHVRDVPLRAYILWSGLALWSECPRRKEGREDREKPCGKPHCSFHGNGIVSVPAVNLQRDSVLPAEDFWARHLRAFRISGGLLLLLLVILFLDHRGT